MKQNTISEFEALNNAINSLNLKDYQVLCDNNKKNPRYCFRTPEGKCLTGWWDYEQLNHFIMGYGKALKTIAQVSEYKIALHGDNVYIKGKSGIISKVTDTRWVHDKELIGELENKFN